MDTTVVTTVGGRRADGSRVRDARAGSTCSEPMRLRSERR
jgi:hypothetical protein